MIDYIIDSEESYKDYLSMIASGEAKLITLDKNIAKVSFNKTIFCVEFADKYIPKQENTDINRIIYGKDTTSNIVNISVDKDIVYIFTEKNGKVECTTTKYKHWVLANRPLSQDFKLLKGQQYYKYIKEYNTYQDFLDVKENVYKMGLYTMFNTTESFMTRHGYTYFKNTKIQDVSLLSFDIETTGLDPNAFDAQVLLITNAFRKAGKVIKKTFNVEDYENQYDMISDWSEWVRDMDPSLIIGHNIVIFDLPYINTIMLRKNMNLTLGRYDSPIHMEKKTRELRVDGTQSYTYQRINIFGREIVDTFFLAIKADIAKKYSSYGLKNIVKEEGLEKPGRTHYDASKIKENWANLEERAKIIAYAEDDADDPIKLYDIMIAPFFYLTPHIPKPFQMMIESATGSQINNLMVRSYLQDGFSVAKADEVEEFEGAISFGNVGIYDNVFKVDVASLYPSIMRHYKIFPEGKDFNGYFLKALEHFTIERLKNKQLAKETGDRYYKDLEQAQKVVINSAYGFLGARGLNYNYGRGASEVTRYGREIITKACDWATSKNYKISNCDTDSISFTTGKDLDESGRKALLAELNSLYPSAIRYEDDGYYKRVIILKAKNYILFDGKHIKLKGSSLKDQKKEPALKEMLNKMIDCLVYNHPTDAVKVYNSFISECLHVKDISRWCAKKSISKAIMNCRGYTEQDILDKKVRRNETVIWDAVCNTKFQEGDKVYLYPAILASTVERKELKNGKIKEKVIKTTGLKLANEWSGDHDSEKLIERVYNTAEILSGVLDMNQFIDYTMVKNKHLLDTL